LNRDLRKIIVISIIILLFGGLGALTTFWDAIAQVFVAFFPFFCQVGEMALEEYLTSPYFIVGIIMAIVSAFGIWFGAKGGKLLFLIVSIICEVISLVSIFSNIL
jgi:hypothetical protein